MNQQAADIIRRAENVKSELHAFLNCNISLNDYGEIPIDIVTQAMVLAERLEDYVGRMKAQYGSSSQRTDFSSPGDFLFTSRTEVDRVMKALRRANQTGFVTKATLHQMIDVPSTVEDTRWGWTNLNNMDLRQVREGWVITLPEAQKLA